MVNMYTDQETPKHIALFKKYIHVYKLPWVGFEPAIFYILERCSNEQLRQLAELNHTYSTKQ